MRKIINGKLYDTDTATYIDYKGEYNCRDFSSFYEELYRKKTGEYFLYGVGGPATKYAEYILTCGYTDGEKIIPLSESEARNWAEENLSADKYIELFGECEE